LPKNQITKILAFRQQQPILTLRTVHDLDIARGAASTT